MDCCRCFHCVQQRIQIEILLLLGTKMEVSDYHNISDGVGTDRDYDHITNTAYRNKGNTISD